MLEHRGKQRRFSFYGLLLLILVTMVIVGCASDESTESEDTEAVSEDTEDVASFFEGKTIRLLVPFRSGSSFDMYPRMMAPALEEEMGVTFRVENLTGAGGMIMNNELFKAEPDGLTLGIFSVLGSSMGELGNAPGIEYSMKDFTWIGRYVDEPQVMVVRDDSPWQNYDDVLASDEAVVFGSTGYTASTYNNPLALKLATKAPIDIVTGFEGSDGVMQALLRGDVDAMAISTGSSRVQSNIDDLRGLVLLSSELSDDFPDTPLAYDYVVEGDSGKKVLDSYVPALDVYRSLAAPPGMSPEKTEYLREMFAKASESEDYKKWAAGAEKRVNYMSGSEVADRVDKIFANPAPALVEILEENFHEE